VVGEENHGVDVGVLVGVVVGDALTVGTGVLGGAIPGPGGAAESALMAPPATVSVRPDASTAFPASAVISPPDAARSAVPPETTLTARPTMAITTPPTWRPIPRFLRFGFGLP
jgi:hypothetical protein